MMHSNDYEANFYLYYLNIFVTFDESYAKKNTDIYLLLLVVSGPAMILTIIFCHVKECRII